MPLTCRMLGPVSRQLHSPAAADEAPEKPTAGADNIEATPQHTNKQDNTNSKTDNKVNFGTSLDVVLLWHLTKCCFWHFT